MLALGSPEKVGSPVFYFFLRVDVLHRFCPPPTLSAIDPQVFSSPHHLVRPLLRPGNCTARCVECFRSRERERERERERASESAPQLFPPLRPPNRTYAHTHAHKTKNTGYVVIKEAFPTRKHEKAMEKLWNSVLTPHGMLKNDVRTWHNDNFPGGLHSGIINTLGVGQSSFQWYLRQSPSIIHAFKCLFESMGCLENDDDDLIVSMDGICFSFLSFFFFLFRT